jgi:predicted small lipoprotein YifL
MNNLFSLINHVLILALFTTISISGCGYKAPPKYVDNSKKEVTDGKK